jgi:predicted DNA-binding transcriptional regulator AlpA
MSEPSVEIPPRRLSTPEAARFVGLSFRTLEKHRSYGTGPIYEKIGGRVVYAVADLEAWLARGKRRSTSDQDAGVVLPAKRHAALSPAFDRKAAEQ